MYFGEENGDIVQTCGTFEWKVSFDISRSHRNRYCYYSANFNCANEKWFLALYPNGKSYPSRGWISLHLYKVKSDTSEIRSDTSVNFRFGIKKSNGVEVLQETQYTFSGNDTDRKTVTGYGFPTILSRSELSDRKSILMPNNELTVVCDLRSGALKNDTPPASTDQAVQAVLDGEKKCLKSLLSLLESGDDSDVVIKVRGKEFPVHRSILRARSEVFHSMFAPDMVENSGVVKIDCDPTTFLDFLKHIYSGRCDHISSENVRGLYTAADWYDFADLKQAFSDFMKSRIHVGCFCDIFTLATKHSDKDLTECATNFFCDNSIEIVKTTGWQTFLDENSTAGNELFLKAMSKFCQNNI